MQLVHKKKTDSDPDGLSLATWQLHVRARRE